MREQEEFPTWVLEWKDRKYSTNDIYDSKENAATYLFYKALQYYCYGEAESDIELSGKITDMVSGESWPVSALGNIIVETDYEIDKVEFGDVIDYDPGKHPTQMVLDEIIQKEII